jgi:hypothetical protein
MGIDATEQHDISGSRGEAHLVWKCKMCGREHTICELPPRCRSLSVSNATDLDLFPHTNVAFDESFSRSKAAYTLDDSENQKFAPLAVLECRGCEITQFDPKGVWQAKGAESNTKFDEIDLSLEESEWNDYDEKVSSQISRILSFVTDSAFCMFLQASAPVSIMEFESRIDRA